jgi:anti-sigma regulatory factor (Ser/Thr protein kinase)
MAPSPLEIELPNSQDAPGLARCALTEWCGEHLDDDGLEKARLLASELVTNAVVHGYGEIVLRAELDDHRVLVEVIDQGGGFEHRARVRDMEDLGGRGLSIVDQESSRWGIHEGTTHVWFELELPGPRLGEEAKPSL